MSGKVARSKKFVDLFIGLSDQRQQFVLRYLWQNNKFDFKNLNYDFVQEFKYINCAKSNLDSEQF